MADPLRIGILGAAKIAPAALVKPAASRTDVEVAAIAARDPAKAQAFATKHRIPTVHTSYADLVADDSLDAVYIPLPNGLHAEWTIAALDAGKHVLCEKPFTANLEEAELVAAAAEASDRVVMEAFHWRYHPLAQRMVDIVRSGELGELLHIDTAMCFPLIKRSDIRWQSELAGGALMDGGCYAVHWARTLAGTEPEVTAATALERGAGIDRRMDVELAFPDGPKAHITASMWSRSLLRMTARVKGTEGTLHVLNPIAPQYGYRMIVRANGDRRRERVERATTYGRQLAAFVAAARDGEPTLTPPSESVANMRVLDDAYRAAGMQPRTGTLR